MDQGLRQTYDAGAARKAIRKRAWSDPELCGGKIVGEIGSTKLDTNEADKRSLIDLKNRLARKDFV